MKFTYDEDADAAYLYLVDSIDPGEVKKSHWVPLRIEGASVIVSVGEGGRALGVEFLGASNQLAPALLNAIAEAQARPPKPGGTQSHG